MRGTTVTSRSCTPGNSKRWWRLSQIPSGRRYLGQLEREFCEGGNFAADLDERAVCGELYTGAEHAKLVDFRLSLTKSDAQECRCPRRHDPLVPLPVMSGFRPRRLAHPVRASLLHSPATGGAGNPVEARGRLNAVLTKAYLRGRSHGLRAVSGEVLRPVPDREILLDLAHDPVTGYRGLGVQARDPAHSRAGGDEIVPDPGRGMNLAVQPRHAGPHRDHEVLSLAQVVPPRSRPRLRQGTVKLAAPRTSGSGNPGMITVLVGPQESLPRQPSPFPCLAGRRGRCLVPCSPAWLPGAGLAPGWPRSRGPGPSRRAAAAGSAAAAMPGRPGGRSGGASR